MHPNGTLVGPLSVHPRYTLTWVCAVHPFGTDELDVRPGPRHAEYSFELANSYSVTGEGGKTDAVHTPLREGSVQDLAALVRAL